MMRVANIIEDGRLAGPQIRIASVAKKLESHEIETTVVFPFLDGNNYKEILDAQSVRYIQLPINRLTKDKKLLSNYMSSFICEIILLYKVFKKQKFDIIHCSGGAWQCKGVIAGALSGTKTIWHLNDTSMPFPIRTLFRIVARFFADGIIVAGNRVKEYYVTNHSRIKLPIFSIQAPVDTERFNPDKIKVFNNTKSSYDSINILCVCNINPTKGIENILYAASLLHNSNRRLNFFITGPVYSSQLKYFKSLLNLQKRLNLVNVHFTGVCKDVREFLKAADIFLCTSIAEASPTVVWEAMSMEKAIISSDVGDAKRFINDGYNGFIVPINDPELLSDRMRKLIDNPEKRKIFGVRSRKIAKEFLDLSVIARNHKDAYQKMLYRY